jgi:hypothetical protein
MRIQPPAARQERDGRRPDRDPAGVPATRPQRSLRRNAISKNNEEISE